MAVASPRKDDKAASPTLPQPGVTHRSEARRRITRRPSRLAASPLPVREQVHLQEEGRTSGRNLRSPGQGCRNAMLRSLLGTAGTVAEKN